VGSEWPPIDKGAIRNILVRSTNWLGDAVMTTPALTAIRDSFPGARITVLANALTAELLESHPAVDEVVIYDRKGCHAGFGGRLRLSRELRERRFDLAILLQNAMDAALIAWLARIPLRMGYATDGRGILLTHRVAPTREARRLHHVDYYLRMLEHFGIVASTQKLSLQTSPEEDAAIAELLAGYGIRKDDFLLGINPGATYGSAKRWYPERFAAVATELVAAWGAKVVITGGPGEAQIAGEIDRAIDAPCINLAGKTSVHGLMSLIRRCNFFITNDSGPMHIAAAFGVPLVAIFGPTDHTTTAPYTDRSIVVRSEADCAPCLKRECPVDHRCMTAVTAAEVVKGALELYAEMKEHASAR